MLVLLFLLMILLLFMVGSFGQRLSSIEERLARMQSALAQIGSAAKTQKAPAEAPASAPAPSAHALPAAPPMPATVAPPEPAPAPEPVKAPAASVAEPEEQPCEASDEPAAIDVIFEKVQRWLAVRGEFAPPGMTHEFAFATRWLVRFGAILIVGAITYFVKLSIEQGWMGPSGRVAMTILGGAAGCCAGTWIVKRTRYAHLGHLAAALGVVALYIGFGLGHCYFKPPVIASDALTFAALFAVTGAACVMSVSLKSPFIAVLGLVGGYATPYIAGDTGATPVALDIYLLVLNAGAFLVARSCKWSALDFLASMLAFATCAQWGSVRPYSGGSAAVLENLVFLSVVHAVYVLGVVLDAKSRSKVGNVIAWLGVSLSACAYFGWIATVFSSGFSSEMAGVVVLGVVAAYLATATAAIRRGWADRETINILLVFSLAFLAVAPTMLFSRPWYVTSWSAVAVAAAEGERRTGQKVLGVMSKVILAVAALSGLLQFGPLEYYVVCDASGVAGMSNGEFLSEFVLRLLRLWTLPVAAAMIAKRTRSKFLFAAAAAMAFLFYTGEARLFGLAYLPMLKTGSVSVAWALAAFGTLWAGIVLRRRPARLAALTLLGVAVAKILLVDTACLATPARAGVFALAGVLLIVGSFLYIRFRERFEDNERQ